MSLTREEREKRRNGIGASEVAAIANLHPYREPLDVYLDKVTEAPVEDEEEDAPQADVGDALEDGLRFLYTKRTGIEVVKPKTIPHPTVAHLFASPDGLATKARGGLEVKVVGARVAHHWGSREDRQVPDYVLAQVAIGMAATDREWWDVAALIGGTDFWITRVERDLELEEGLIETAVAFWTDHVAALVAPPPRNAESHRRYLLERYPGSEKTSCVRAEDPDLVALVATYQSLGEQLKTLKEDRDETTNAICERIGAAYGVEGEWGKFIWPKIRGKVDWKAVAEEVAGGSVPLDVIEKHRGAPYRSPRYYEPKKGKG